MNEPKIPGATPILLSLPATILLGSVINNAGGVGTNNLLKSIALDNLFGNLDTYTGSARNYYIYHNLTTQKWEWIKWDGNESFGSYSNGVNNMTSLDLDYHNSDRPLIERIFDNETF